MSKKLGKNILYADTIPFEDQERDILSDLFYMAVNENFINLPDRHPGAKKVKQYKITLIRYDDIYAYYNFPQSNIEMWIEELDL